MVTHREVLKKQSGGRGKFADIQFDLGPADDEWLKENDGKSSQRQREAEQNNAKKWLAKWGKMHIFDEYGMIKPWTN